MHRLAVGAFAGFAALAGCLKEKVPYCDNGAYCPEPLACTGRSEAPFCGPAAEVAACVGAVEEAECTSDSIPKGYCRTGICTVCTPNLAACRYPGWVAMDTGTSSTLNTIWVAGPRDVYAAGDAGTVIHYDGERWSALRNSGPDPIQALWGIAADHLLTLSTQNAYRFDGTDWVTLLEKPSRIGLGLWGAAPDTVFGVGQAGMTGRYDGAMWKWDTQSPAAPLAGVWGTSANDVFEVGNGGAVFHFAAGTWTLQPTNTTHILRAVWGTSGTNVFAAGNNLAATAAVLLHYDGTWSDVTSSLPALGTTTPTLKGLWGASATDVYAVGNSGANGHIIHFDGTAWSVVPMETAPPVLNAVAGAGPDAVFAVGVGGTVLRYSGR